MRDPHFVSNMIVSPPISNGCLKHNVSAVALHTKITITRLLIISIIIIMKFIFDDASSDSQDASGDAAVSGNTPALTRSGSSDDKCIGGEQAANTVQAIRVTSSKKDIRRQQCSHFLNEDNVYDADSEDEDAGDEEATVKAGVSSRDNVCCRQSVFRNFACAHILCVCHRSFNVITQEPSLIPEQAVSEKAVS